MVKLHLVAWPVRAEFSHETLEKEMQFAPPVWIVYTRSKVDPSATKLPGEKVNLRTGEIDLKLEQQFFFFFF